MKKNNMGFTLIELIAVIVLLAIVASIGTYSIVNIVKKSREENYNLLIKNINSAAETYYQECKYSRNILIDMFSGDEDAYFDFCDYDVSLGELVAYGYLQGNAKDSNDRYIIVNPLDNSDISRCEVNVKYENENIKTTFYGDNDCPTKNVEINNDKVDYSSDNSDFKEDYSSSNNKTKNDDYKSDKNKNGVISIDPNDGTKQ